MTRTEFVTALIVALVLFLTAVIAGAEEEEKTFHNVKVANFGKTRWTHVCTVGVVTLRRREEDRDWHLRISDGDKFIVAEIIPELPLRPPVKGDTVKVCGIRRFDDGSNHGWWEVHPVTKPIERSRR